MENELMDLCNCDQDVKMSFVVIDELIWDFFWEFLNIKITKIKKRREMKQLGRDPKSSVCLNAQSQSPSQTVATVFVHLLLKLGTEDEITRWQTLLSVPSVCPNNSLCPHGQMKCALLAPWPLGMKNVKYRGRNHSLYFPDGCFPP